MKREPKRKKRDPKKNTEEKEARTPKRTPEQAKKRDAAAERLELGQQRLDDVVDLVGRLGCVAEHERVEHPAAGQHPMCVDVDAVDGAKRVPLFGAAITRQRAGAHARGRREELSSRVCVCGGRAHALGAPHKGGEG